MTGPWIRVSIAEQQLYWLGEPVCVYPVSTGRNGVGELNGSGCTPRGWHRICAKIGADAPLNAVFVARRATGEIYSPSLASQYPRRDWILTRILWLSGLEPGYNRFGERDTRRRYIYIHGCPDHETLGIPLSHGCIRMNNRDVMLLFQKVQVGDRVLIEDKR